MGKLRCTPPCKVHIGTTTLLAITVCLLLILSTYLDMLLLEKRVGIPVNGVMLSYAGITEIMAGMVCIFWFTKAQDAKTLLSILFIFLIWAVLTINILGKVGR